MAFELKEICGYLRDILTFRNFVEIPDNRDSYFTISAEELMSGVLNIDENKEKLVREWCKKGKDEELSAEVLLILKVVCDMVPKYESPRAKRDNQIWEYKRVSLLYLKAQIDSETYELSNIKGESVVWADPLVRRCESKFLTLFRRFVNIISGKKTGIANARFCLNDGTPIICGDGLWRQYIGEVDKHFEKRIGKGLFDSFTLTDDHGVDHNLYVEDQEGQVIVMKDETVFAARHIASLLNGIENESAAQFPLFNNMVVGNGLRKKVSEHMVGENVVKHLGQMKRDFPLADAQRDVVHCFSDIAPGEVLAVSGPPGTGKTTMLQSIVADMVVKSVVQAGGRAPFILASSSNNKAITNIIDAFDSGENDTTQINLHHRWLCYETEKVARFVPMADYCHSASVDKKKLKQYFVTDTVGGLNYGSLRNRYYRDSSDFYYRASLALNLELGNPEEVMNDLFRHINRVKSQLVEIGDMINNREVSVKDLRNKALELATRYKCKFDIGEADTLNEVQYSRVKCMESIDRLLDTTLRFDLYWLSVHYNECNWIMKIEEYRKVSTGMPAVYGKFLWEEVRYICPCVVSTFYMAPKLFEFNSRKHGKTYNYGLADLLIVDEAGQVSPEIGLPAFALAKKALVVGDEKQIPPVYGIPSSSEEEYWENRISSNNKHFDRNLLSCCESSIMAIAEDRCLYERKTNSGVKAPGLFLNEHRRCVDEIISYSNELVYNGDLAPKRGSHKKHCRLSDLPPIGFFQTDGKSEIKDGSRYNVSEVKVISDWLRQNAARIEAAYADDKGKNKIRQLVSIITPFKAQSKLFKEDEYLKDFPSGTVHTFQGAESPIVIFSLVYGKSDNPVFIKKNHELMNVAVSRAKDHFLIFGNRECLENNLEDRACLLLHKMSLPWAVGNTPKSFSPLQYLPQA